MAPGGRASCSFWCGCTAASGSISLLGWGLVPASAAVVVRVRAAAADLLALIGFADVVGSCRPRRGRPGLARAGGRSRQLARLRPARPGFTTPKIGCCSASPSSLIATLPRSCGGAVALPATPALGVSGQRGPVWIEHGMTLLEASRAAATPRSRGCLRSPPALSDLYPGCGSVPALGLPAARTERGPRPRADRRGHRRAPRLSVAANPHGWRRSRCCPPSAGPRDIVGIPR